MRVLVTGGAGYIGSHVARSLADSGHSAVVLDRADAAHVRAVADVETVRGDVGDPALLASVFGAHRFDAVVHLAGLKSVEASLADPGAYFQNNVGGTLALLRAMVAANVACCVFSSTCAVYSPNSEPPLTEAADTDPQTPYGETKLAVERMLRWFERAHGLRSVSLRYFNAAGAADDGRIGENWHDAVNLVPVVMRVAAGRLPALTVHGSDYQTPDGTAIRDYVHVVDLADAHLASVVYLAEGGPSATLNLGSDRGSSVLEVVAAAERASGRPVPLEFGPRRPGDLAAVWADSSRAASVLGWRASRSIEDIADSAWRWHAGAGSANSRAASGR